MWVVHFNPSFEGCNCIQQVEYIGYQPRKKCFLVRAVMGIFNVYEDGLKFEFQGRKCKHSIPAEDCFTTRMEADYEIRKRIQKVVEELKRYQTRY